MKLLPDHFLARVTVPALPSTVTIWPLRIRLVAVTVPNTAEMPYSRATIEPWLKRSRFRYAEGDGYQSIELPYLNREVAMVILLPGEERFHEIEKQLTSEWAQGILRASQTREVILTMPQFRFEMDLSLEEALSSLGMPIAFSDGADLSGILEPASPPLAIDKVLHRAFIDVNEQRTEAAAVMVVEITIEVEKVIEPTPPPPVVMKIDRPFIFFIRDIRTDTILFVGRVLNPAEQKQ